MDHESRSDQYQGAIGRQQRKVGHTYRLSGHADHDGPSAAPVIGELAALAHGHQQGGGVEHEQAAGGRGRKIVDIGQVERHQKGDAAHGEHANARADGRPAQAGNAEEIEFQKGVGAMPFPPDQAGEADDGDEQKPPVLQRIDAGDRPA